MKKIFTLLLALAASVGLTWVTTVTWDNSTLSSIYLYEGESFTEGGVTLTLLNGEGEIYGTRWMGDSENASFKFSTSLGNFTRIEITGTINSLVGSGWTETSPGAVWTGDANETTFGNDFENVSQIVFTIEEPVPAPKQIDELPYQNSFDTEELQSDSRIIDANNDTRTWAAYNGMMRYTYSSTNAGDDWLVSPMIKLIAGKVYKISLNARAQSNRYQEKLEVKAAKDATASSAETAATAGYNSPASTRTIIRSVIRSLSLPSYSSLRSFLKSLAMNCQKLAAALDL